MKLTGKCKEAFEEWYMETRYKGLSIRLAKFYCSVFHDKPDSEKYGVYVDFFDSVGIFISMNSYGKAFWYDINPNDIEGNEQTFRPEARTAAIEKANDIFNELNK